MSGRATAYASLTDRVLREVARAHLAAARRDLGADLGGFSPVDLLLDQGVAGTVDEARALLAALGEVTA